MPRDIMVKRERDDAEITGLKILYESQNGVFFEATPAAAAAVPVSFIVVIIIMYIRHVTCIAGRIGHGGCLRKHLLGCTRSRMRRRVHGLVGVVPLLLLRLLHLRTGH